METYEVLVMFAPEVEEARRDEILGRIRQIADGAGGAVEAIDDWGRRKLAYEIRHESEATYRVATVTAPPAALAEITRVLKISDDVLRHMATRKPRRPTGPVEESVPVA